MVQRVGAGGVLLAVLAGHGADVAVGQGALDLALHGGSQPGGKGSLCRVVGLGCVLDSKKAFLLEIVRGLVVGVRLGLVRRVPLPEHGAQQALVQLPQLAQGVAVVGGSQGCKGGVCGLLVAGFGCCLHRIPL